MSGKRLFCSMPLRDIQSRSWPLHTKLAGFTGLCSVYQEGCLSRGNLNSQASQAALLDAEASSGRCSG